MAKKDVENNKKSKKEEKNKRHFFKDFKAELKKVVWPTPKQLFNSTIAVIVVVLVIGAIVFLLDLGFEILNKYGIDKVQSKLQESYSNTIESTNTTSEENTNSTTDEASSENLVADENNTAE